VERSSPEENATSTDRTRRAVLRSLATSAVGVSTWTLWVDSLSALARQQAHAHSADSAIAAQDWKPQVLNAHQNDLVIALTELIIPETDTPGAKAARVNRFVDGVLNAASAANRDKFLRGLDWIDERSKTLFGKDFLAAGPADQTALLTRLSTEGAPDAADRPGAEFFQAIKAMTINGYYTTEVGLRRELGDDGQLALAQFKGCDHPEHQS
jgi:hypothetical protein